MNEYEKAKKEFETCKNCHNIRIERAKQNIFEFQLGLEPDVKSSKCSLTSETKVPNDTCDDWTGYDFDLLYDGPMPEDEEMEVIDEKEET